MHGKYLERPALGEHAPSLVRIVVLIVVLATKRLTIACYFPTCFSCFSVPIAAQQYYTRTVSSLRPHAHVKLPAILKNFTLGGGCFFGAGTARAAQESEWPTIGQRSPRQRDKVKPRDQKVNRNFMSSNEFGSKKKSSECQRSCARMTADGTVTVAEDEGSAYPSPNPRAATWPFESAEHAIECTLCLNNKRKCIEHSQDQGKSLDFVGNDVRVLENSV